MSYLVLPVRHSRGSGGVFSLARETATAETDEVDVFHGDLGGFMTLDFPGCCSSRDEAETGGGG